MFGINFVYGVLVGLMLSIAFPFLSNSVRAGLKKKFEKQLLHYRVQKLTAKTGKRQFLRKLELGMRRCIITTEFVTLWVVVRDKKVFFGRKHPWGKLDPTYDYTQLSLEKVLSFSSKQRTASYFVYNIFKGNSVDPVKTSPNEGHLLYKIGW